MDIDDDVLLAAKELAAREKKTAGKVLSEYFRRAFHAQRGNVEGGDDSSAGPRMRNGVPVLPSRGEVVTTEKVERIMEEEGI